MHAGAARNCLPQYRQLRVGEQEIRTRVADLETHLRPADLLPGPRRPARQGLAPARFRRSCISSSAFPAARTSWSATSPITCCANIKHPDLHKAINEAFRIAERQLLDLKEQRDGRTKDGHHDVRQPVARPDRRDRLRGGEFGFLLTKEGGLLYFHRNSMLSGDFDELERGDEVYYVEDIGDTGPIATKVRVKERR